MSSLLPPEIIETIVNHLGPLPNYDYFLRWAALISRAWSIPSQRVLFRSLDLEESPVSWFCTHLRRYPHLQNHIRHVTMFQRDMYNESELGDPPSEGHLAALTAMFSLMPNLTSLRISFDRYRPWSGAEEEDESDESFLQAFGAFLRGTPSLNTIDIRGLRYEEDFQQMFLYLENTSVKRVSLQLDGSDDTDDEPELVEFFTSTLEVIPLPQVETLRFRLLHTIDIIEGLKLWFAEHRAMLTGLKHLEIVVRDVDDFDIWFRDILQSIPTLRLESFRMEFDGLTRWLLPTPETNLFNGLHFDHLKLGLLPDICPHRFLDLVKPSSRADFYTWLSSKFHLLTADSVYFTELTFAVADTFHSGAMWDILDHALSLEAFGGVKRVHFETRMEKVVITDWAYPDLASQIRSALPRLDSRGVLCFM